jgi:hypothetical protein
MGAKRCAVLRRRDDAAGERALLDVDGLAHRIFEIEESGVVLVRPDNAIALVARPADAAALRGYVERLRDPLE